MGLAEPVLVVRHVFIAAEQRLHVASVSTQFRSGALQQELLLQLMDLVLDEDPVDAEFGVLHSLFL